MQSQSTEALQKVSGLRAKELRAAMERGKMATEQTAKGRAEQPCSVKAPNAKGKNRPYE